MLKLTCGRNLKVLLHVNYYEGAGRLPALCRLAAVNGCDGVELRGLNRYEASDEAYWNQIKDLKQAFPDFEFVFGGPAIDYMVDKPEGYAEGEDKLYKTMLWAKENCGTKLFNFFLGGLTAPDASYYEFDKNGSTIATEEQYQRAADGLHRINTFLDSLNMRLALESHNCYIHDLPDSCAKILTMADAPRVGINFDYGNIFLNKKSGSLADAFKTLKGRIFYSHLKNSLRSRTYGYAGCFLEAGHINNRTMLEGLVNELPDSILAIEYPSSGDGFIAAKRDMEYIRFLEQTM